MIKLCAHPTIEIVAHLAGGRKFERLMVGVGRDKILRVAGDTFRRHMSKLADGCPFMAGITGQRRMCAEQWETVIVVFYSVR